MRDGRRGALGSAVLLGCGWVRVAALMCDDATVAEFERCIGDCDGYTCQSAAFSGSATCDVVVSLGDLQGSSLLPAEGVWRMQCEQADRCGVLKREISENANCCPHGSSISEYFAVCPNGFPAYSCNMQCAPEFLYFWTQCAELYQNQTAFTALSNDGTETVALLPALESAAVICRGTVYREGAKSIYQELAVYYFPFAGWIILMVPFMFFLVFVFFGRHLASLFRMVVGAGAFGMQILWPAVAPFIARCGIGISSESVAAACATERPAITADVIFDIVFAFMVALLAGYACRQLKTVGNTVQGFTLGFVVATWTTDLWIGGVTQNMDMDFVVLAISAMFGLAGAVLNVLFPNVVNMFGSSVIGSFCCCQLFCVIGYFENWYSTFPVSLLAAGLGVAGCETGKCYAYLMIWVFLGIAGVTVQWWSGHIETQVGKKKPVSVTERLLYRVHQGFQTLLDMEDSIREHAEFHSKEEMAELAEHHAATWAAAATAVSDLCLMSFGTSLLLGGAELLYRGVYHSMVVYFIWTGGIAILFTVYEMQVHNNVTVEERIRQFDIYIWGVFVCVPFAATGFFVSLTLGLESDPLGLHDDFAVDDIQDIPSTDGTMTYRTFFMRHMQVAAVAFFGLTISSCVTCTVISKNIGGLLYLMRKINKFVALALLVYGAVITYVGFGLKPDETFAGMWIYEMVGGVGALMVCTGLLGVIGGRMNLVKEGKQKRSFWARNLMPMFAGLLFTILGLNLIVFIAAGLWASNVHTNVGEDWSRINSTMAVYCEAHAAQYTANEPCHLTQDEFAAEVLASFQLAMAVGIVTTLYMFVGLIAAVYMAIQTEDTLSHADALVQKHAKEYLGSLAASEHRKKHGKKSAVDAKKEKDAVLATVKPTKPPPPGKKRKRKKKKKVQLEQDASGEWTTTEEAPPPPPPDGEEAFPGPPDGDPPPWPADADEEMENPLALGADRESEGPRRIGSRTIGGERVYTKVEKKAIARQKKQQEKLQAQQQKRDAKNEKDAAKRAAKREKQAIKKGESSDAAAPGATFDMEDAPAEASPGRGNNGSSSDLSDEVFSDEPPPYDERPPSLAESSGLENQVGNYQWVTDSDAETEYETDEEYQYHTTDSDEEV